MQVVASLSFVVYRKQVQYPDRQWNILVFCSVYLFVRFCLSVPDRQYEVRVWAFNKQTDGAAAVWKGRTDKVHGRSKVFIDIMGTNA